MMLLKVAAALALVLPMATAAQAHPHVFVDARSELIFDAAGAVTAVRHTWQFDEAFSAFAIQGLDANGDGKLSDAELVPLAKINVESLKDYEFFTGLKVGGKKQALLDPTKYWLEFHDGRLTLFFTLPLKAPVSIKGKATLEVYDPQYFVAFAFKETSVALKGAPAGCSATYRPPKQLDNATMAVLGTIPADQLTLPPELANAAAALANLIVLQCP